VEITDLTTSNTEKGAMGQFMEIFLNHKVQENALGKLSAAEKKGKRCQAGLAVLEFLLTSWPTPMDMPLGWSVLHGHFILG
jgi:hypothetical protein